MSSEGEIRLRGRGLQVAVAVAGVAAILVCWVVFSLYIDNAERSTLRQARKDLTNLAVALEEETERTVRSVDQIMLFMKADFERDPASFALERWLGNVPFLQPLSLQIGIIAPSGGVAMTSLGQVDPKVNLSDREHFQVHAGAGDVGLFISKPVIGRVSGKPAIQLSRRLTLRDGSFGGVIVVSLDPDYIERFLVTVDIGESGTVALVGTDGLIRARASKIPASPDALLKPLTVLRAALAKGNRGTYEAPGVADGADGIYSYHKADGLPLVVTVGMSRSEILSRVSQDRMLGTVLVAVTTITIWILIFWLVRELDRRRRTDHHLACERDALGRLNADLKDREIRLAEKSALLELALEHMDQGILMIDADRTVPVCNLRAMQILDLPADLLASRPSFDAVLAHQWKTREFDGAGSDIQAFVKAGGIIDTFHVYERERPNGRVIEVRSVPIPNGGAVRTFSDVTERRAIERDLRAAKEEAEAANLARTNFLATMSHEIRTPLNGVIGLADILTETALDPEQRKCIATLQASADHLLQIISDVLDFAKLDTENVALDHVAFDLPELVQAVISLANPRAAAKRLDLRFSIAPELPASLVGDPMRLRQVLLNLVGNAVKFTESGYVTLDVALETAFEAYDAGDAAGDLRLTFSVSDTGIGIPESARAELFKEFHQVDGAITRRYGGTGLGLAISRRFVTLMGGEISVDSVPDRGSRFYFTVKLPKAAALPRQIPEADAVPMASATLCELLGRPTFRVLLAEDNPTNQFVATSMLRKQGCTCDIASNGREAIEAVRRGGYDLVLMDMMMPELDGLQATKAIRGLPGMAELPILALTANAFTHDEKACLAAGMTGFISKPINGAKLINAVLRLFGKDQDPFSAPCRPAAPPIPANDCLEPGIIAELRELYGADLEECFAPFLHEAALRLAGIGRILREGDRRALSIEAHTLKGACQTFGFRIVAEHAAELERLAARNDGATASCKAVHAEAVAAFEVAKLALGRLLLPAAA